MTLGLFNKKLNTVLLLLSISLTLFNVNGQNDISSPQSEVKSPAWSNDATIYELNVRQFSNEGTFDAIIPHLDRIKDLGIEIIWLMPIHPIGIENRKGGLGSYYAVKDYKGVNPEFGDDESFKNLVSEIHKRDMRIIIDWVANHTSPDNIWVEEGHLDWYNLDSLGNLQPPNDTDWYDVSDLNYDNKEMRSAMIDAMEYWVRDMDIDGFRCDVAGWVPVDFWNEARNALDEIKQVFMLAEAEGDELHESAFDMTYGWEFHHIMNEVAAGRFPIDTIPDYFDREREKYRETAYRMHFTSNHDENSWNGTEFERMGEGAEAYAVLASTIHGMPLVYNGQETSLDRRLAFFEKDSIVWDKMDKVEFYTNLLKLNAENKALWNGVHGGYPEFYDVDNNEVLCFRRNKENNSVLVILNLSPNKQKLSMREISIDGMQDLFEGKEAMDKKCSKMKLGPWEYKVYHQTN